MQVIYAATMWRKIAIHSRAKVLKPIYSIPTVLRKRSFTCSQTKHTYEQITPVKMSYSTFESGSSKILAREFPIIIMHGLLGSRQNWLSVSKVMHNKLTTKVISVDARNHGDSPHSPNVSYEYLAEDVRLLMRDLEIPQATLIGHSMGGRTMMLVALKYPQLVRNLVVVDISPIGVSANLRSIPRYLSAMKNVQLPPNLPLSAARKQAEEQIAEAVQDVNLRKFLLTNLIEGQPGHFHWRVNVNDLASKFGEIAMFPNLGSSFAGPTLFVGGANSDYIRPEEHSDIRRFFPQAEFRYIPGAGHWVHAEKPAEFINVVCEFLSDRI